MILSCVVLALVFAFGPAFAEPAIVSAKSGLNIREKPDVKSAVLATAPFGADIDISEVLAKTEVLQGKKGVWMKVNYVMPGGDSLEGYAFDGFLFHETGNEDPYDVREKFVRTQFGIAAVRQGRDDTHWSFSLKLQGGRSVVLFQNDGKTDDTNDYFLYDYFAVPSFVMVHRKGTPDFFLVDYTTGKITRMNYGSSPVFNPTGSAYFESASGGMFGYAIDIYELVNRAPRKVFGMEEQDLPSWDRLTAVWKDASTIECRYVLGGGTRGFILRKNSGTWVRTGDCTVDSAGRCR